MPDSEFWISLSASGGTETNDARISSVASSYVIRKDMKDDRGVKHSGKENTIEHDVGKKGANLTLTRYGLQA